MKISRVALDLAKNVIQVHAVDRSGAAVVRKALKRAQLLPFMRDLPPCEVGMEACASAHHWGRQLQAMGHTVHLLPAQYVKPFVIGQKNDANDAAAICAAMTHPGIPRVTVKTVAQQDMQALHRIRSMKMKQRTAIINQTRGLLVHGARSVLRTATDKPDDRSRWLMNLAARRHRNIATVAQANKTVRIAWAILTREQRYRAA